MEPERQGRSAFWALAAGLAVHLLLAAVGCSGSGAPVVFDAAEAGADVSAVDGVEDDGAGSDVTDDVTKPGDVLDIDGRPPDSTGDFGPGDMGQEAVADQDASPSDVSDVADVTDVTQPLPPVVLNEVRCADSDFIELYNLSTQDAVSLDGWRVSDGEDADHQFALDGRSIGPREWLVIPRANASNGVVGFPFGLGCGSDTVRLHGPGNLLADSVALPEMAIDETWGRLPDGTGVWQVNGATPGLGNLPPVDIEEVLYSQDRVVYLDFTVSDQGIQSLSANPYDWVEGTFELESEDFLAPSMQVGVRLKGRYGSFQPVEAKASFKVAFNFVDPIGRFLGLKPMPIS